MDIADDSTAWFDSCDFLLHIQGVEIGKRCDIDFRNFRFYDGEYDAICIGEDPINVNIEGCYFQEIGHRSEFPVISGKTKQALSVINCLKNAFENCVSIPLGIEDDSDALYHLKKSIAALLRCNEN